LTGLIAFHHPRRSSFNSTIYLYHEIYSFLFDLVGFGGRLCASIFRCSGEQHVSRRRTFECSPFGASVPFTHPPIIRFCFFLYSCSVCFAKHVQDKAAKWAKAKRPRKSRPSDINRKPIIYEIHTMTKPAEYSISDAPASLMAKPTPAAEN
jgi:hypothetical protein